LDFPGFVFVPAGRAPQLPPPLCPTRPAEHFEKHIDFFLIFFPRKVSCLPGEKGALEPCNLATEIIFNSSNNKDIALRACPLRTLRHYYAARMAQLSNDNNKHKISKYQTINIKSADNNTENTNKYNVNKHNKNSNAWISTEN
jgi:hypothetical protein